MQARAISVELGSFAAMAMLLSGDVVRQYCCQRSLSQAWYLGRAICSARLAKIDILDSLVKVPARYCTCAQLITIFKGS